MSVMLVGFGMVLLLFVLGVMKEKLLSIRF